MKQTVLPILLGTMLLPSCASLSPVGREISREPVRIYGEIHGTQEIPRHFYALVNSEPRNRGVLHVGVELTADDLSTACSSLRRGGVGKSPHLGWISAMQDGRRSRAMATLICDLRRKRGVDLFPLISDDKTAERDQMIADAIIARTRSGGKILALVGNLHARNTPASAAGLVRSAGVNVETFVFDGRKPSSAWICSSDGICGSKSLGARFCSTDEEVLMGGIIRKATPGTRWDRCISLERFSSSSPI